MDEWQLSNSEQDPYTLNKLNTSNSRGSAPYTVHVSSDYHVLKFSETFWYLIIF